jgi:hypothetical protein
MSVELINSSYIFSLYPNLLTVNEPSSDIDINQLIEIIRYGYIKDIITLLRSTSSRTEYNAIKKEKIPCVTLSGRFTRRSAAGIVKHSGLMQADIDKVADFDSLFSELCNDKYAYLCFRSPGGKGIKMVVKVNPSVETHKSQFTALEKYFKESFGIEIDTMCKDVARAMLLSYDPDIFCNPWSEVFSGMQDRGNYLNKTADFHDKNGSRFVREEKVAYDDESIDLMERLIDTLEKRHIDITGKYEDWIRIGFALCTKFGEKGRGYFHRIGRMYPHYTPEETDRTYTHLLATNDGRTRLGTIIYLAGEASVKISNYW